MNVAVVLEQVRGNPHGWVSQPVWPFVGVFVDALFTATRINPYELNLPLAPFEGEGTGWVARLSASAPSGCDEAGVTDWCLAQLVAALR